DRGSARRHRASAHGDLRLEDGEAGDRVHARGRAAEARWRGDGLGRAARKQRSKRMTDDDATAAIFEQLAVLGFPAKDKLRIWEPEGDSRFAFIAIDRGEVRAWSIDDPGAEAENRRLIHDWLRMGRTVDRVPLAEAMGLVVPRK